MSDPAVRPAEPSGPWRLKDARAHFAELVRRVRSDGPQHVTVDGQDTVVVISAEEFRRLTATATGRALVDALQASPHRDVDLESEPVLMSVRDVDL